MKSKPFLRPRLSGARFEHNSIPLELLKDISVIEEMIIELAKAEYLKDHSNRHRSPRGFTDGIELKLTGIEAGSAVLAIDLFINSNTIFPSKNRSYFERARDALVNAIDAADQNLAINEYLPEKALIYFDRMGRSLRDGDVIEFPLTDRQTPAKLTRETRRRLLLTSTKVKELTEETQVRGKVPTVDQDNMNFEVQTTDGRKIRGPVAAQHFDTIMEAFNGYRMGVRLLLQGIGRFNRSERLLGFDSIEHVTILDPLDVPSRLDELRHLKHGWLEGQGVPPAHEGLDWLSQSFCRCYPDALPLPFLYPTAEGGIQAEWTLADYEITLNIDLTNHIGHWHILDMKTDDEKVKALNLNNSKDWEWFARRISEMAEDSA